MLRQIIAGIIIATLAATATYYYWRQEPDICQICRRPMHDATSFFVTLEDGQEVELCCPRCGMRFMAGREDVESSVVADYLSEERIPASKAFYVVGSSVHPFCSEAEILHDRSGIEYERTWDRCLPSVIAFRTREDAREFQAQYGGEIAQYDQLILEDELEAG